MLSPIFESQESEEAKNWFDIVLEFFGELGVNIILEILGSLF